VGVGTLRNIIRNIIFLIIAVAYNVFTSVITYAGFTLAIVQFEGVLQTAIYHIIRV